jgi:hypothetical protein
MGSDSCAHASSVPSSRRYRWTVPSPPVNKTYRQSNCPYVNKNKLTARGEPLNLRRCIAPRLGHRRRARHERQVPKQKALDIPRALDEGHGSWKVRRAELVVAIGGD